MTNDRTSVEDTFINYLHTQAPKDDPVARMREHIRRYRATGGIDGHIWTGSPGTPGYYSLGAPTLVIAYRGRKSGKTLENALIYGRDGENFLVVASKGGGPEDPEWYLNMKVNPRIEVQVLDRMFPAIARVATTEEKIRLWPIMDAVYPIYISYRANTSRDIPIVVLEPIVRRTA